MVENTILLPIRDPSLRFLEQPDERRVRLSASGSDTAYPMTAADSNRQLRAYGASRLARLRPSPFLVILDAPGTAPAAAPEE